MLQDYNISDNIITTIHKFLYKGRTTVVREYIDLLFKIKKDDESYDYLDGAILNRKITNILFGKGISVKNNLDTIIYTDKDNVNITDRLINLFDDYIRLKIRDSTGLSFDEFKHLNVIEKILTVTMINFNNKWDEKLTILLEEEKDAIRKPDNPNNNFFV